MNDKQKNLLLSLIHLYGTKRVRCYSVNVQRNGPNETKENTERARDKVYREIEACLNTIQEEYRDKLAGDRTLRGADSESNAIESEH